MVYTPGLPRAPAPVPCWQATHVAPEAFAKHIPIWLSPLSLLFSPVRDVKQVITECPYGISRPQDGSSRGTVQAPARYACRRPSRRGIHCPAKKLATSLQRAT